MFLLPVVWHDMGVSHHLFHFKVECWGYDGLIDIWQRVRNSEPATSRILFEIYCDTELLASLRAEVATYALRDEDGTMQLDIDHLLRLPILQAVYTGPCASGYTFILS